jgi:hypothetical protein
MPLRRLHLWALLLFLGCSQAPAAPPPAAPPPAAAPRLDTGDALAIASDAYLYAYPLLLMEITRRVQTNIIVPDISTGSGAPMNRFTHISRVPDALLHGVAYPDLDALKSSLWFDVSKEPLIIEAPDTKGRYLMMTFADMWTDVFAAPGTRTQEDGMHLYAIAGPDWQGKLPPNVEMLRSPTNAGLLQVRIGYQGVADAGGAQALQGALEATPLSRWGKKTPPEAGKFNVALPRRAPVEQVADMKTQDFFDLFVGLLAKYPPHANDTPMLQRLRLLGLQPGQRLVLAQLPPNLRAAVEDGVQAGQVRLRSPVEHVANGTGGWQMPNKHRGTYGTDYALRARAARADLVSPLSEDLIQVRADTDSDGRTLDGTFRYEIRFRRGQLPPVRAYWSITLYNDRAELFDNPLNRYGMGTRNIPAATADQINTIYVQYPAPVAEQVPDWLPSPQSGRIVLELRMYRPRDIAVEGVWEAPEIRRIH